jgi:signal transduction histidine kinase
LPIRWRLTLFIALAIGAILLALGLTLYFLLRGALLSGVEDTVQNRAVTAAREVQVTFDRGRVLQVASILLDNAVRYTPEGGSVTVGVRDEDGRAALQVSDTGVGIPEDQLPLVFERFHRADLSRADGGAGLSIARQIAESHGGKIRVWSKPGKGSTFTLLLPQRPRT